MEREVGEVFEYNGGWYQCVKSASCGECAFFNSICIDNPSIKCSADDRNDNCSVVFKKLEKVGEPVEFARGLYFQRYSLADSTAFYEGDIRLFFNASTKMFVYIEIKQKEEDMEEKKLNLKPFDLEAARSGKPVCTRDGRKARIVCFDKHCVENNAPIVACVISYNSNNQEFEDVIIYKEDGTLYEHEHPFDLMMLPEKKEGWVNICRNLNTNKTELDTEDIYNTRKEALQNISSMTYITTVKIQWSE